MQDTKCDKPSYMLCGVQSCFGCVYRINSNVRNGSLIVDTLWQRCFWIVAEQAIKNAEDKIEFDTVDALVTEKTMLPVSELLKFLGV